MAWSNVKNAVAAGLLLVGLALACVRPCGAQTATEQTLWSVKEDTVAIRLAAEEASNNLKRLYALGCVLCTCLGIVAGRSIGPR